MTYLTPLLHASLYLMLLTGFVQLPSFAEDKEIVGWVEKVRIPSAGLTVQGKLDTGADHSSLSATHIQEFSKNGEPWISFTIESRYGESKQISTKIVRTALIKRLGGKPSQKRPVIRLGLCLGSHYMETDINIVDRSNFEFQLLIGRDFLAGNVLIDPASTYMAEPNCTLARKP